MEHALQVDVAVLTFLVGTVVPLVTGLVTKLRSSSRLKAMTNLVLSVLGGVGAWLINAEGKTTVGGLASAIVTTYLASGVSYQNLWKPTGAAQAVQEVAPESGIGTVVWPESTSEAA